MSMLTRFDAVLDALYSWCRAAHRWLRRRFGGGTLPPVYQTTQGHVVDRVERVPLRSSKADGKRAALAYARTRTGNPKLTWGAARHLMKRWEREERKADRLPMPRTYGVSELDAPAVPEHDEMATFGGEEC